MLSKEENNFSPLSSSTNIPKEYLDYYDTYRELELGKCKDCDIDYFDYYPFRRIFLQRLKKTNEIALIILCGKCNKTAFASLPRNLPQIYSLFKTQMIKRKHSISLIHPDINNSMFYCFDAMEKATHKAPLHKMENLYLQCNIHNLPHSIYCISCKMNLCKKCYDTIHPNPEHYTIDSRAEFFQLEEKIKKFDSFYEAATMNMLGFGNKVHRMLNKWHDELKDESLYTKGQLCEIIDKLQTSYNLYALDNRVLALIFRFNANMYNKYKYSNMSHIVIQNLLKLSYFNN